MVGTYGACCDISRTWLCGEIALNDEQKRMYQLAYEHIMTNMDLLKPGVSFLEISKNAHQLSENCIPNRYSMLMHGVGLCDEYPSIYYQQDWEASGQDGVIEPGMVISVEVYAGEVGGSCGVKLEDQVLITEDGFENMTSCPFEDSLLN